MTVLDKLNFVVFKPLANNNPIAVCSRKLVAKIDEQIQLAANKDYTSTQQKRVAYEQGNQKKVECADRAASTFWWTSNIKEQLNERIEERL